MKNKTLNIILLIASIIIVAGLGSLFVNLGINWFDSLIKPTEWIPDYIIPVVWSVIYLTFLIILLFWINASPLPKSIVIMLIINGILNILWCLLFFTLNQLFIGNIFVILNTLFAIALILEIYKTHKIYALILTIYPAWLCIATTLNLAVWILN